MITREYEVSERIRHTWLSSNIFKYNFSTKSRGLLFIERNPIAPLRGHGCWGRSDAMGPMSKITSARSARAKNTLKIIIIGLRDSLHYVIFF